MSNLKESLSVFKTVESDRKKKEPVGEVKEENNQEGAYKVRRKAPAGIPSKTAFSQSLKTPVVASKTPPTEEQEKVIECEAGIVKVKAFAGAGKTFTLTEYAKRRSRGRGLYLAFNRDIKEEALSKFPPNVKCMTSHGLAFPQFGKNISHKLNGYIQWDMIYNGAGVKPHFGNNKNASRMYSKLLQETVGNFIASDQEMIQIDHVPLKSLMMLKNNPKIFSFVPDITDIVVDAEKLWLAMSDPTNTKVLATHDVYLKQMQLARPNLPYDYILLDEAQDSNPAILDLVQNQSCIQVLVGDPHQSIYSFRKAVDAMTNAKADETLELTTSFRFGNNIADFANALLLMKGETSVIQGLGGQDRVYTGAPLFNEGKTAFISRVNATLIKQAATYVVKGKKVYFAGGVESARFDLLEDIYMMCYNTGKPRDPLLASFRNYDEFKQAAEDAEEVEWTSRCKLVEEMGRSLIGKLNTIKHHSVDNPNDADQIFSTVHKSKGLQFENVILADDFYKAPVNKNISDRMVEESEIEEMNIYYVGATRAMKNLNITNEQNSYWRDVNRIVQNEGKGMLFEPAVKGNEAHFKKAIEERKRTGYYDRQVDNLNKKVIEQKVIEKDPFEKASPIKKTKKNTLYSLDDPFDL